MTSHHRYIAAILMAFFHLAFSQSNPAFAQMGPALAVYGPASSTKEGDPDFEQKIYISVPADYKKRLYLRIFDPDTNHKYDTHFGAWGDTRTLFALLGGKGASTGGGKRLMSRVYGSSRRLDGRWSTFTRLALKKGELKGNARLFRLDVRGLRGNDGNIFDVTVSKASNRNIKVPGVRVYTFKPTVRVPDEKALTELKFKIPKNATSLTIHNFDAANADIWLVRKFASTKLTPSGQDEWRSDKIEIAEKDRGKTAAVTVQLGSEIPNDVTIYVTDQNGVEVPIEFPIRAIAPNNRPVAAVQMTPQSCKVTTFDAAGSFDKDDHDLSYLWRFADGTVKAGRRINHSFASPGEYRATLEVTDSSSLVGDGTKHDFTLAVKPRPVARIKIADVVARGFSAQFDGTLSSAGKGVTIPTYFWDFGDGTTGAGARPTHVYAKPGKYLVRLTVRDSSGHPCDIGTNTFTVTVNAEPQAAAGSDLSVVIGEPVLFDGKASRDPDGAITDYTWDFGDGGKAKGKTRQHSYWIKGTYRVRLTVKDNSGLANDQNTDEAMVNVTDRPNQAPIANAGPDRTVIAGEIIAFDGSGSKDLDGSLLDMKWNFGNGDTASTIAPRYAYPRPGTYRVKLTVKDASGLTNDTMSHEIKVTVNHPPNLPPVPNAGPNVSAAIAQSTPFDASASRDRDGNIIRYDWDFGDGAKGRGIKTAHAYAKSGTYTVKLMATDSSGRPNARASATRLVKVNEPPVANAGPHQLVTSSEVQFDGTASNDTDGKIARYRWDFGDGITGTGATPRHVYRKPGTYQVTLTVDDDSGTIRNTHSAKTRVIVNAAPIADAGPDIIAAPDEKITFDGSNSVDPDGTVKSWQWDFRDGAKASGKTVEHKFAKPGTYIVRLKVMDNTDHSNAVDFAETRVVINQRPVAHAGPDMRMAPGDEIIFDAGQSFDRDGKIITYRWDFLDSSKPVIGPRIKRTFKNPGIYKVQLSVIDDSTAANAVANDELTVAVNHAPVAEAGNDIVSSQLRVVFEASASADADGDGLSYIWNFGDGTTATGVRVAHTYKTGGKFPVILKVDDGTGLKNATATDTLTVKINRVPVVAAGKNRNVCTGDVVVFDGSASTDPENGVLRYSWDFGDGTKSQIVNPTKKFLKPGNFPVTLTVQDDSGLKNSTHSDRVYVRVNQAPVAVAGPDILACTRVPVQFDGKKSFDLDGVVNRYSWDFGDGSLGGGDRPRHAYTKPGTYRVTLNIEGDQVGQCDSTASDQLSVRVIEAPIAKIVSPKSTPLGAPTVFDGSGSTEKNGKITDWLWNFGDGATASGANATHIYKKPGLYKVTLTIKSATAAPACRSISTSRNITVNAPPVAKAGDDVIISVGQEMRFDGSKSYDSDGGVTVFAWDFGDGTTGTGLQPVHKYAKPGRYRVKLVVKDNSGLKNDSASDALSVLVKPAPYAPIKGPDIACVREPVTWQADFGKNDLAQDSKLTWFLGDGTTSTTAKVTHSYQRAGKYNVTLFVDETHLLKNSRRHITKKLFVNQPPLALAGPDQLGCAGRAISFDGSVSRDPDGKISAVKWDFGDGATSDKIRTTHGYKKPGTYIVRLSVRDDANSSCSMSTDKLKVVINAPPLAEAGPDLDAFIGGANDAVLFDGSQSKDPDGDNLNYDWQIGNGLKLSGARVKHLFTQPGEIPVKLTVRDRTGLSCGVASDIMTVKIRARNRK